MPAPRLLIIAGSARQDSLNRRLAAAAGRRAQAKGLQVSALDLRALALPVYDGDFEAASGVPAGALELQQAIQAADGLLIVTPEYNGFPTPLVINAFDWLSRIQPSADRPAGLAVTANRPAALMSASPGPLGALRSMNFLRQYLQMAFAMVVVPQQFALGRAHEAFDEAGELKEARSAQAADAVLDAWARMARALAQPQQPPRRLHWTGPSAAQRRWPGVPGTTDGPGTTGAGGTGIGVICSGGCGVLSVLGSSWPRGPGGVSRALTACTSSSPSVPAVACSRRPFSSAS